MFYLLLIIKYLSLKDCYILKVTSEMLYIVSPFF